MRTIAFIARRRSRLATRTTCATGVTGQRELDHQGLTGMDRGRLTRGADAGARRIRPSPQDTLPVLDHRLRLRSPPVRSPTRRWPPCAAWRCRTLSTTYCRAGEAARAASPASLERAGRIVTSRSGDVPKRRYPAAGERRVGHHFHDVARLWRLHYEALADEHGHVSGRGEHAA